MKPILRFNFNPSKVDQVPVLKLNRTMDKYQQGEVTMSVIQRNRKDKERKFEAKPFARGSNGMVCRWVEVVWFVLLLSLVTLTLNLYGCYCKFWFVHVQAFEGVRSEERKCLFRWTSAKKCGAALGLNT